ncbi:hypothetical protein K491DRAFT_246586 [Lophiostoma macrostomum CBS 122681]|uniref:Uncharacterized protein n=1 Tax=Lophiostoma macrostomum CBS 122681 TaxID=1314788 RepID=A0A6A6TJJ9_9PLEO|nr:hypothetical protein K491DRAFT_246586 [Lophiostoma macrostomum CBS 122681]
MGKLSEENPKTPQRKPKPTHRHPHARACPNTFYSTSPPQTKSTQPPQSHPETPKPPYPKPKPPISTPLPLTRANSLQPPSPPQIKPTQPPHPAVSPS